MEPPRAAAPSRYGRSSPADRRRSTREVGAGLLSRPLASYYLVLSSAGLLLGLGLVMVLSASSVKSYAASGSSFAVFVKQAMWVAVGLPVLAVASRMTPRVVRWLAYPVLLGSLFGLLLVMVPGLGVSANGATRWVGVGQWTVQPSEFAKLGLALWGADLLVRKQRLITEWRHLLVPLVPVASVLALFVMLQPDMGTTIVLVAVLLALLWVVGSPLRLFAGIVGVIAALGTFLAVTEPYRLQRLTSFTDPFRAAHTTGYQAVQGIYAISSGGWWGLGLGASREKWSYLPNAHTDFIMAIIGEELGLLGTLVVVLLFGVLGYAGIRVASRTTDPFARLAAAGLTAWLLGQAVVNMGAVVGLLPITGIPLPLISFGGSSLVPTLTAVGLLAAFARTEPDAAAVLDVRRERRTARAEERRTRRRELRRRLRHQLRPSSLLRRLTGLRRAALLRSAGRPVPPASRGSRRLVSRLRLRRPAEGSALGRNGDARPRGRWRVRAGRPGRPPRPGAPRRGARLTGLTRWAGPRPGTGTDPTSSPPERGAPGDAPGPVPALRHGRSRPGRIRRPAAARRPRARPGRAATTVPRRRGT